MSIKQPKVLIVILFLVLALIGCSAGLEPSKEVIISSVNFEIETPIVVKCDSLLAFFPDDVKRRVISDQDKKNVFQSELSKLKKEKEGHIDARARIYLIYQNKVDSLCADRFFLRMGDQYYEMSDRMRKLIWPDEK